ncbi:MAG TPA: hypothetical protein VK325_01695 [Pseudoxanthomonas sp.]|nr:hypothetical protein [Pseudoxanthomonas sp.]
MNRSSLSPAQAEALSAFADTLDAVEQRVTTDPPASNLPPGTSDFFFALSRERFAASSCGRDWGGTNIPAPYVHRLARVDRCLAGISGVSTILHAALHAQENSDPDQALGHNLTDRLHFALAELVSSASSAIDSILESSERVQ